MGDKTATLALAGKAPERHAGHLLGEKSPKSPNPFFGMQQSLGNQAMLRLLESGAIQAKLRVSQPGDPDEVEAERVADSVVSHRHPIAPNLSSSSQIQRASADVSSTGQANAQASPKTTAQLIVADDEKKISPNQMRKSQFIALLRTEACAAADAALLSVGQTTRACPYIEKWLSFYEEQSAAHVERALHKYAPETATARSAQEATRIVATRIRRAAIEWAKTGKVSGLPPELASQLPGQGGLLGALHNFATTGVGGATMGFIGGTSKKSTDADSDVVQRKAYDGEAAPTYDAAAVKTQLGPGHSLDPRVQSQMSTAFGYDFSSVRIHTDSDASSLSSTLNARAFTIGSNVAFASGEYKPGTPIGDALIAHELAHVVQQGSVRSSTSTQDHTEGSWLESDADHSAASAVVSIWSGAKRSFDGIRKNAAPRMKSGLRLQRCGKSAKYQDALAGRAAWTADFAREALDHYRTLSPADRDTFFNTYHATGQVDKMISALSPALASGADTDLVMDLERRSQRAYARESAQTSGLANENAMAQAQANFMIAQNTAAATAALGGAPPTPAQVAAQQQTQVASTSIAPSANALTPAQVATHTTACNAAVVTLVAYAGVHHPELGLTAADFHVDIVGLENRGAGVIAYGETVGGRNVATVGRTFTKFVNANPAYAMSVVVHELHGHPEYGPYGQAGTEYGLELYDKAAALMPGYVAPAAGTPGRTSELDAYAYQETEIYSLLRSLPYHTKLAPADAALQPSYVDPDSTVSSRITLIKSQWEPKVAKALLRGLYRRLKMDPRITPAALAAFKNGIHANYTGPEAATANDILK